MEAQILKASTVVAAKNQVWCELAGGVVILQLKSSIYYGLNETGARVWRLIQEPKPVRAVLDLLLETYEVAPDECEGDLMELLQELATWGLIETKVDANGAGK